MHPRSACPPSATSRNFARLACRSSGPHLLAFLVSFMLLGGNAASAREAPVGYTLAREVSMQQRIEIPGFVETARSSIVAVEVAGLITEMTHREGDRVSKGDVLARLRSRPIALRQAAAEAELSEARARLTLAKSKLERINDLFASTVSSRQDVDDAQAEWAAWSGRVERLTAEVARIADDLDKSVIRAPFDGVVVEEYCDVGEWRSVGEPIVEMIEMADLQVRVDLPERYYAQVRIGTEARLRFEALDDRITDATVVARIPKAATASRSFPLILRFPKKAIDSDIAAGMLVHVGFDIGPAYDAIIVPKDALIRDGRRTMVYVLNDENEIEVLSVEPGHSRGSWTEIGSGLTAGQKVITRGNERLAPGMSAKGTLVEYAFP